MIGDREADVSDVRKNRLEIQNPSVRGARTFESERPGAEIWEKRNPEMG